MEVINNERSICIWRYRNIKKQIRNNRLWTLRKAESDISFVKLLTVDRDVDCTKFDLDYVKNIHKYILSDIYDWAGEFRTVPMEKPEEVLGGDTVRYAYPKEIEPI